MINRIKKLTKIFLKDYYQNLNIFNKKNNKLNKKSIYFWLIIIIIACISYISLESILFSTLTSSLSISSYSSNLLPFLQ